VASIQYEAPRVSVGWGEGCPVIGYLSLENSKCSTWNAMRAWAPSPPPPRACTRARYASARFRIFGARFF
jgi:hypothetical protein